MRKRTILLSIIAVLISARFASAVAQTITNFTPTSGPSGTSVTITGTALTGATGVAFGGVQATSKTVTSDTQIVATVPGAAATGRITVTTPSGLAASPTYFTFVQNPTSQRISSFSPTHGATGTPVTLVGTNLTGATSVKFGVSPGFAGIAASSFAVDVTNPTSLTAVVASNTPTGLITVTTPAGTGTSTTFFTVDQALLAVRADFQNFLYTAPPASQVCPPNADGSGCGFTFFNGEVWGTIGTAPPAGTPNNGQAYLVQSSFGQPFPSTMIYVTAGASGQQLTFIDDALTRNKKLLYYTQADGSAGCNPYCKQDAAFRYKDLQYDIDPTAQGGDGISVVNQIEARLKPMSAFYGANERARSVQAEQTLRDALKYAPTDRLLRNALLDLYYDRTVAELTLAREKLVNIQHLRLEPVPPGDFLIDREIAAYEDVLGSATSPAGYRFAESGYLSLLRDTAGVDTSTVDSTASSGLPFGYYMYRTEVPVRSLYAATYLNGGVPTPVANPGGAPLFSGYKDQVMMFNLFSDYAQVASELAKRYVMRGGNGDSQLALNIVNEAQQKLFAEGNVFLGVFPAYTPQIGDASGLGEAIHGWRHGLSQLTQMRDFIRGGTNVLGFADDVLMLADSGATYDCNSTAPPANFDSYDTLASYVIDQTKGAPLTSAVTRFNTAMGSYSTYRGHQDQLGEQFDGSRTSYNARLHKITGVDRGAPGYETPETNVGSEIYLQLLSIDIARNRIFLGLLKGV